VTSDLAINTADIGCSSPFVQRVWVSLEAKGLQYQYIEVDPYKKPQALLDVNPRGLVPGIRHGDWGCGESTVLMEYVCFLPNTNLEFLLIIVIAGRSWCRPTTSPTRQSPTSGNLQTLG
jgi:hypothetical protein